MPPPESWTPQRHRLAFAAALVLAAIFVLAMLRFVLRRADTTYRYPAYSSLNNGESGTKAYFETLARLGVSPSRNFKRLEKLVGTQAAVLYAGVELWSFRYAEEKDLKEFEELARRGARVIIALDSEGVFEISQDTPGQPSRAKGAQLAADNLKKRWGIEAKPVERSGPGQNREFLARFGVVPVTWRFSSWPASWRPSQVRDGSPLFLERVFGSGAIVLMANSKLFTNRELLVHPDAEALAYAPGEYREIIFDESHLGLADTGSVMGLAAAHNLEWMLVGFVVLGILHVWRSSVSFVPPLDAQADEAASGRDAHLALSHLLMQSVPRRAVLRVAAEEWNRSAKLQTATRAQALSQDELNRLEHIAPHDAAAEYRSVAARLNPKELKR